MNKYLSDLMRDSVVKWKLIFILLSGAVSVVLTCMTKNLYIAVFYIVVTTILEILAVVSRTIKLEGLINNVMSIKKIARYVGAVLVVLAIMPTVAGCLTGEIVFHDIVSLLCYDFCLLIVFQI